MRPRAWAGACAHAAAWRCLPACKLPGPAPSGVPGGLPHRGCSAPNSIFSPPPLSQEGDAGLSLQASDSDSACPGVSSPAAAAILGLAGPPHWSRAMLRNLRPQPSVTPQAAPGASPPGNHKDFQNPTQDWEQPPMEVFFFFLKKDVFVYLRDSTPALPSRGGAEGENLPESWSEEADPGQGPTSSGTKPEGNAETMSRSPSPNSWGRQSRASSQQLPPPEC